MHKEFPKAILSVATIHNAATKQKALDDVGALVSSEGY
jgi:hypothetical protein